ncbi:MAG: hypothetical protein RMJ87_10390 [Cytophagales bacterium]|nr:hypothetical protein [Bernardetiaceae bacterium]MDW8205428.1 hypothetical protein [Cytophagales bacterium]
MEANEFSLAFFRESANGDKQFMKYILLLTARELQQYFEQLTMAVQEGHTEQIRRAVHKLRPHLESLQAVELEKLMRQLANAPSPPSAELLQTFQQKAALLCSMIQQAADHET